MVGRQAQGGMWGSRGFIRQYRWWGHGDKADGRGHGRQRVGDDSRCMVGGQDDDGCHVGRQVCKGIESDKTMREHHI